MSVQLLTVNSVQSDEGRVSILFDPASMLKVKPEALRLRELKTGFRLDVMWHDWQGNSTSRRRGVFCSLTADDADKLAPFIPSVETQPAQPVGKWKRGAFEISSPKGMLGVWGWRQGDYGYALHYTTDDGEVDLDRPLGSGNLTHVPTGLDVGAPMLSVNKAKRLGYRLNTEHPRFRDFNKDLTADERSAFAKTVRA